MIINSTVTLAFAHNITVYDAFFCRVGKRNRTHFHQSELSGKEEFREVAINILNSLCNIYLSGKNEDGILKHGCFHKPENMGVDESLIWGDYYFIEAIMKVIKGV